MTQAHLPVIFALLIFLPVALFLVVILLLGIKLGYISEKDAVMVGLAGIIVFLLLILKLQKFFKNAWGKNGKK